MNTRVKTESKPRRLVVITKERLEAAKTKLDQVQWAQKKRQSVTAQTLEYLRDQIEAGRAAGVSWPRIAETVNEMLGTSIHAATIRSYFSGQKITDKEAEKIEKDGGAALDLSAAHTDPAPDQN